MASKAMSTVRDCAEQFGASVDAGIEAGKAKYEEKRQPLEGDLLEVAVSGAFNTLAVAAVTLMVVVFVVSMIADSMNMEEGDEFYESFNTIVDTTGDALNLAAVALIVLIAAVILFLVRGFGDNGSAPGSGRM